MALTLAACTSGHSDAPGSMGSISGRVVLTGLPPRAGLQVDLTGPSGPLSTTSDVAGDFRFVDLAPGTYSVVASVGSTREGTRSATAVVPTGGQASVSLAFTPYGTIVGSAPPGASCRLVGMGLDQAALAGPDGVFRLPEPATLPAGGLAPGPYRLSVSLPETVEGTVEADVIVGHGELVHPPFAFTRLGSIEGRLILTGLPPEAGLEVNARAAGGPLLATRTDADGAFSFTGLPPGSYDLSASVDFTEAVAGATTVEVPAGATATAALVLVPFGTVEVAVLVDGAPAPAGAPCRLVGQGQDLARQTDATGRCSFPGEGTPPLPGLQPGSYLLSATVAAAGTITQVVQVGRGPALASPLRFIRLVSIVGGVGVQDFMKESGFRVTAQLDGGALLETFTGLDGTFAFEGVTPGTYAVSAYAPHTLEQQQTSIVSVEAVTGGEVIFHFMPRAVVVGVVHLGSGPPPAGTRCSLRWGGREFQSATTGQDGAFRFPDSASQQPVTVGAYTLSVSIPSTRQELVEVAVVVERLETVVPALDFTPEGGLAGLVTRAGGAPAAGALVWLEATGDAVRSGADGAYRFSRVPAGTYRVHAVLGGHQQGSIEGQVVPWNEEALAPAIALAADAPGQPTVGSLAGTVSVAGLGRQQGVLVSVDGLGRSAVSGPDGSWRIDGVPVGLWSLSLSLGDRSEQVPAAVATPGSEGYLLDERLYPIGDIELQGGRRICSDCWPVRSGGTADGKGLVIAGGTRLLAVPLDGGPDIVLAEDLQHLLEVSPPAPGGAACHVIYDSLDGGLKAVPCAGGPSLTIGPSAMPGRFSPDGRRYAARGADGMIWYADLELGEARPVVAGNLAEALGPDYVAFIDSSGDAYGSLAWADGRAARLVGTWSDRVLLDGGARLLALQKPRGSSFPDAALVGPASGPLEAIVESSEGVWVTNWTISPDGRSVALALMSRDLRGRWVVVASTIDGHRIATLATGSALGHWSPDSRVFVNGGAGAAVVQVDGGTAPELPCRPELFSDDGRLAACRATGALVVLDANTWSLAASMATGAGSEVLGFTPDGAGLWARDDLGLHRLDVPSGTGASQPAPGNFGAALSPDRRWVTYATSDERVHVAPASGGPAVTINPPELPSRGLRVLEASDMVAFWSGLGTYLVPAAGGAPLYVGDKAPYGWPQPLDGLAPGGGAISWLSPEGVLKSAQLPGGDPVEAAVGVRWFDHLLGGLRARTPDDQWWVGPEVGQLRPLGPGINEIGELPTSGRVAVRHQSGAIAAVRIVDADVLPLATCLSGVDEGFPQVHDDRLIFSCGGVLHAVPTEGGAVTPSVRGDGPVDTIWFDARHFMVIRAGALPPYRFQNGTYLVALP